MRDLINHRQQWIHNVSRARRERERISHQRRDDGDVLRILADDAFGHAHEEIHASCHFHRGCRHNDRQDDDEHLAGNRAGRNAKPDHQHEQADRPPQAQPHAARPRAHEQRAEEDGKFEDEFDGHALIVAYVYPLRKNAGTMSTKRIFTMVMPGKIMA